MDSLVSAGLLSSQNLGNLREPVPGIVSHPYEAQVPFWTLEKDKTAKLKMDLKRPGLKPLLRPSFLCSEVGPFVKWALGGRIKGSNTKLQHPPLTPSNNFQYLSAPVCQSVRPGGFGNYIPAPGRPWQCPKVKSDRGGGALQGHVNM